MNQLLFDSLPGGPPLQLEMDLTRAALERTVNPVIERCRAPVLQAVRDAQVTPQQIDRIVFVGGPTRMPVCSKGRSRVASATSCSPT